jgi:hypothetical protein
MLTGISWQEGFQVATLGIRASLRIATFGLLVLSALTATAGTAMASEMVTFGMHNPGMIVNRHGVARVSYTTSSGLRRHVLVWGAVNAITPKQGAKQVHFKFDYSGGSGSFGNGYWKRMHNYCRKYTGPKLADLVQACDAPDGSHWAIQSWRRELRDGGWKGTARQHAPELHVSHWTGKMAQLFADTSWLQNGKFDRVFGYLHYDTKGVYGFSSTSVGAPTDSFGRNMYIDTHNPALGKGWFRFNSGLTHRSAGNFCLGLYKLYGRTHTARGDAYRLTAMGPGVTPIVSWHHKAPGKYSAKAEKKKQAELDSFTPAGDSCRSN